MDHPTDLQDKAAEAEIEAATSDMASIAISTEPELARDAFLEAAADDLADVDQGTEVESGLDELADGIATIFAALHEAGGAASDMAHDEEAEENGFDDEHDEDLPHEGATFMLLGELDRLWQRAA